MTLLAGTGNQLSREIDRWGSGGRWARRTLIWTVILAGLLAVMIWVLPRVLPESGSEDLRLDLPATAGQWVELAAVILATGATIGSQGILLDDRKSGVLEWVLSKPLSRNGLVVAKYSGNVVRILAAAVLVPWLAVWVILTMANGGAWPVGQTVAAMVLMALLAAFQIALVLALSAFTWSRGVVLGVPLAMVLGSDMLMVAVPSIAAFNPYMLGRIGAALMQGVSVGGFGPAVAAVFLALALVVAAALRLQRLEF